MYYNPNTPETNCNKYISNENPVFSAFLKIICVQNYSLFILPTYTHTNISSLIYIIVH